MRKQSDSLFPKKIFTFDGLRSSSKCMVHEKRQVPLRQCGFRGAKLNRIDAARHSKKSSFNDRSCRPDRDQSCL